MTDRHVAYTVILEKEIREDDAEAVVTALKMVKGVLRVVPKIGAVEQYIANERARHELQMDLWKFLNEWRKGKGDG